MNQSTPRKFQFLRAIASGGFGDVYLCKEFHSSGFSRLVAVKILRSKWAENEEIVARMRDEAKLLGLLRHRNIIKVHELTSLDKRTAVVMEYLDALDLGTVIEQMRLMKRRLPPRVSLEITATVAVALDAAYNQPPFPGEKPLRVIHRDIKPSNIMIEQSGLVKVLDFGVAQADFDTRESSTRELQFGSLEYMAPERLFFEPETPASDIYSLSASLFECLAAQRFGKASARHENHAERVEARIRKVVSRLKISPEAKKELAQLLRSGLSFEGTYRLSAVEFAQRARMLARAIPGIDLVNWSEKAIPYIRNKIDQQVPVEGTLLHKIIIEDSIVLRTPTPKTPVVPSETDQDSLSRGALAELTLVDPTEQLNFGEDSLNETEVATAQINFGIDNEETLISKDGTYTSDTFTSSEVTLEREIQFEDIPPTDEIDPLRSTMENTTRADDPTLELSTQTPRQPLHDFDNPTENISITDVQKLQPKPTALQQPNRPYNFEQNDSSFESRPNSSPPFPWFWLLLVCVSLFGIIITGFYFGLKWLDKGLDEAVPVVQAVDEEQDANLTGVSFDRADYPEDALVFVATDPETYRVMLTCDDVRVKDTGQIVMMTNKESIDCQFTIYETRSERYKLTVSDVTNGLYQCDRSGCQTVSE